MKELISVIVPIYNVEKYLQRCVESILSQSYSNIEILLVDDGSTDDSGLMCDQYVKQDSRVRVLHKKNGGLSDARNAGLAEAQGRYVCFFDSDDWVESDILEKAYRAMNQANVEVVIWGFYKEFVEEDEKVFKQERVSINTKKCSKTEGDYQTFASDTALSLVGYAWNKLYDRKLLSRVGLSFEKGVSLVEDILFNGPVLSEAKGIQFIDEMGNHYIQRKRETLGSRFYPDYYELKIQACQARESLLCAYGAGVETARKCLLESYFAAIKSSCRMVCQCHSMTSRERRTYMKEVCETETVKKTLQAYHAHGKDILFKLAIQLGAVWVFERMYGS